MVGANFTACALNLAPGNRALPLFKSVGLVSKSSKCGIVSVLGVYHLCLLYWGEEPPIIYV